MTTRRTLLRLAGAAPAAALLGACDSPRPAATTPRPADRLLVQTTGGGLAIVDVRDNRAVFGPTPGLVSYDRLTMATTRRTDGRTTVEVRMMTGDLISTLDLTGNLSTRVVAPSGTWVALTKHEADAKGSPATTYRPAGRRETAIVVAGGGREQRIGLPGCVEPEAFSGDGSRLYVLDYLPPLAPDRYRVRALDLGTGGYGPLYTRDKRLIPAGAEEEMRGVGRQAVYAPGRKLLFTLYTHQPDHAHTRDLLAARSGRPDVHAFVHTLSVDGSFAYCVDLPAPFGTGPAAGHAIALNAWGQHPYVVDATTGTVAAIDADNLTVRSVTQFKPAGEGSAEALVVEAGSKLILATGRSLRVFSTGTLSTVSHWTLSQPARGLALAPDGRRLWVGRPDGAVALDLKTGREVATVSIPGLSAVTAVS